jgi:hypothetical protein
MQYNNDFSDVVTKSCEIFTWPPPPSRREKITWNNRAGNVPTDATLRHVSENTVAVDNQLSITYYECAYVALVIKHAMRMRPVTSSSVAYLPPPNLSTLSPKRHGLRGGGGTIEHNVSTGFYYFFFFLFLSQDAPVCLHDIQQQ